MMPFMKHIVSRLRESRSVILISVLIVTVIGAMGGVFFYQGKNLMENELKERLRLLATNSALLFESMDLESIREPEDASTKTYRRSVLLLDRVRTDNPDIRFIYILRPTQDPAAFAFVSDADSLNPFPSYYDLNQDGRIDEEDELAPPGTPYDISEIPQIPEAMERTVIVDEPYSDQWGTYMSGFAPVRNSKGKTVGVLGVDIDIGHYKELSTRIFSPIAFLLVLLAGFLLTGTIILFLRSRKLQSLLEMNRERSGLLRLTFHQLGQPITILKWSLEMLRDSEVFKKNADDQSLAQHADNVNDAINRIDFILQELHVVDQIHEGVLTYDAKPVELAPVIRNVAKLAAPRLAGMEQTLELSLEDVPPIRIDEKMIAAVVQELLDNAIGFSPVHGKIRVALRKRNGFAELAVQDGGCGIPAKDLANIFKEFFRASNAYKMKPDGTGLGLYIVKGIVERAGGRISIDSREGKGTTVTVSLPMA